MMPISSIFLMLSIELVAFVMSLINANGNRP